MLIEMIGLKDAYPKKIKAIGHDEHGWFLTFYEGTNLYWAEGRMLPKDKLICKERYARYFSYGYEEKIPDPRDYTKEQINQLKKMTAPGSVRNTQEHELTYYTLIYAPLTEKDMNKTVTKVNFLGSRFKTSKKLIPSLKKIEKKLKKSDNEEVKKFIADLDFISSYSFRVIAGTKKFSYHSFGVAVDLLPLNRNQVIFWGWTAKDNENWPIIPLKDRWQVPQEVVNAFEEEGYLWGGKWDVYDIMHFEYRPERYNAYCYQKEYKALGGS